MMVPSNVTTGESIRMKGMKDIAAEAGVSVATVSLVMNNKPGVGEVTRRNVLRIANSLNYKPRFRPGDALQSGTVQFLRIAKHGHIVNDSHKVTISDYVDGMTTGATDTGYNLQVYSFSSAKMQVPTEGGGT